jgi:NAD(P)-dependent dehydrogenase (short-subunit alcohol dehydrogenase family)
VITGPSVGSIGAETAISLAYAKPSQIILLGRTESKALPVVQKIKSINDEVSVSFFHIDLASLASVRKAAAEVNRKVEKIDYLINAGIMGIPEFKKSEDGIELQFASNHVGHFLLTNLLMEKIITVGRGARIVNVSSNGFELGEVRFDDWNFHICDIKARERRFKLMPC